MGSFAVGMLDMSVPVVAKLRRLLDSLPKETLPDILASMIRTTNKEKLQVQLCVGVWEAGRATDRESYILDGFNIVCVELASPLYLYFFLNIWSLSKHTHTHTHTLSGPGRGGSGGAL